MKKSVVFLIMLFVSSGVFAQNLELFKATDNKEYGFKDESGKVFIDAKYDDALEFSEGLAAVKSGDKWGFIDINGDVAVELKYDGASSFSKGLAAVKSGNKWGFINKTGDVVVTPQYDGVNDFSEYGGETVSSKEIFAAVKLNGTETVTSETSTSIPVEYKKDDKTYSDYSLTVTYTGSEITSAVGVGSEKDDKLTPKKGTNIIEAKRAADGKSYKFTINKEEKTFTSVPSLKVASTSTSTKSNTITVSNGSTNISSNLVQTVQKADWGFIDKDGKVVVELQYDDAHGFSDGLAAVKDKDKWNFIDKDGKVIISDLNYDDVSDFSENFAAVKDGEAGGAKSKWGFIDKKGKELVKPTYSAVLPFSGGLAAVKSDKGKWGYINTTGKLFVSTTSTTSTTTVSGGAYDEAMSFSSGLAAVKKDDKWGFIGTDGKVAIDLKYDAVSSFSDGLAKVEKGGKWGYINSKGNIVGDNLIGDGIFTNLKYDDVSAFSEGLAVVGKDGKFGFINEEGKLVVEYIYDDVSSFSNKLARVGKDGKYGFIDNTGKVIVELKYDNVSSFNDGSAKVELNGEFFYIDKTGKRTIELFSADKKNSIKVKYIDNKIDSLADISLAQGYDKLTGAAVKILNPDNTFVITYGGTDHKVIPNVSAATYQDVPVSITPIQQTTTTTTNTATTNVITTPVKQEEVKQQEVKQQATTSNTVITNTPVTTNNTATTNNTVATNTTPTTTVTTTPVKKVEEETTLSSPDKTHSIKVKFNKAGKIGSVNDVTMDQGYKGTEKVTKISDDGKGFTFTTATGAEYIVSNLDATGVASYQTTKVVSTVTSTNDKDTTELFMPNKTHSIKVKLDNAGKIVSAALAQGYKETDKFKKISADGKSFTFTNATGAEYTITPALANSTYNTVKN